MKTKIKIFIAVVFMTTLISNFAMDSDGSFSIFSEVRGQVMTTTAPKQWTRIDGDCYAYIDGVLKYTGDYASCSYGSGSLTQCTPIACMTSHTTPPSTAP